MATRSKRQIEADEASALRVEESATTVDMVLGDLSSALDALASAKEELKALDAADDVSGPLVSELNVAFNTFRIVEESWWAGAMNGPSVRKFFSHTEDIFNILRAKMLLLGYLAADLESLDRHFRVLRAYSELSPLMRTTDMLTEQQILRIEVLSAEFGVAFRERMEMTACFQRRTWRKNTCPLLRGSSVPLVASAKRVARPYMSGTKGQRTCVGQLKIKLSESEPPCVILKPSRPLVLFSAPLSLGGQGLELRLRPKRKRRTVMYILLSES